jgi:RHS repeat-associated protein
VVALSKFDSGAGYASFVEKYSYSAFGETTVTLNGNTGNPYRFTGREYESETGLYYYRARFYNPAIGRFLQTDPIGYSDSMNLYAYVGNNPVNWIDPWGLASITIHAERGRPWGKTSLFMTWLLDDTGHSWVEIKKDDSTTVTKGLYPGGVADDSWRNYRTKFPALGIERTYEITDKQANNAINYINNYVGTYKGVAENCTDFVYHVVEKGAGVDMPGSDWGIDSPDKLADDLKAEKNNDLKTKKCK